MEEHATAATRSAARASTRAAFPRRRCSNRPSCITDAQNEFATHGIRVGECRVRRRADAEAQSRASSRPVRPASRRCSSQRRRDRRCRATASCSPATCRIHRVRWFRRRSSSAKHVVLALGIDSNRIEERAVQRRADRRFVGRARFHVRAEAPRRDRRRRHRPRTRQRLAPTRPRSGGPRGAATVSAHRGPAARQGSATRHFKKLGLDIRLGAKVSGATIANGTVDVRYADASGRADRSTSTRLVVAIGRRPYTADLLGPQTGVRARRARLHQGGPRMPHQRRKRLGGRRLRARTDACAQGQGRGRDGRRT